MKKLIAAAVASVFAVASLSGFAAGYEHRAPVQQTVVKHSDGRSMEVHKVRYGKKVHHRHYRKHHHRRHF